MDHRVTSAPAPTRRAGLLTALAAGMVLVVGAVITPASSQAAPPARPLAASGSTTTTLAAGDGAAQIVVSPVKGLPASGAQVTVRGSGFDSTDELWIAVCQDDGIAPDTFTHCLGGPIPDFNSSTSWGVVNADGTPPVPGPVVAKWRKNGSFTLTLQVLSASGQDADCLADSCSLYIRAAADDDMSADGQVPLRFATPPGGTALPSTTASMTTEVIGGAATTVAPDTIAQQSVAVGDQQSVTFSGFEPGETVDVTLFSDPIELPTVQADGGGIVTVTFDVPEDLSIGEHLVQAIGRKSGRVGIAQFQVGEAVATTTETSATETTTETSETSSTTETTPASEVAPTTELTPTETTALPTTAASTDAEPAEGSGSDQGSGGALWLWIALIVIVLLAAVIAAVILIRRRREPPADLPVAQVAPAAPTVPTWQVEPPAWQAPAAQQSVQDEPPVPDTWLFGDSGRQEYQGYQVPPAPTAPPAPAAPVVPPTPAAPPDPGPGTEQWRPDWLAEPSPEPGPTPEPGPDTDPNPPSRGRHIRPD